MTVDVELVTRKLLLIAGDLDTLAGLATRTRDVFVSSRIDQLVAERLLERAIGRMIDVNYHLITEAGQPPPSDHYASFVRLADLGVLDPAFARRLAPSAGLRNRLVARVRRDRPVQGLRRGRHRQRGYPGLRCGRRALSHRAGAPLNIGGLQAPSARSALGAG